MMRIQFHRINKIMFLFLLLGFTLLYVQVSYAQRQKVREANPDDYLAGPGEKTAKERIREAEARKKKKSNKSPGEMGGLLGVNSKNKSNSDRECVGKLKVNIAASQSIAHVGKPYTFVALSTGGCKGTYKYQWSGTNLNTGNGKRTGLLNKNSITASFKNLGTSTISVAVVDSKNNHASDRVTVKVVP